MKSRCGETNLCGDDQCNIVVECPRCESVALVMTSADRYSITTAGATPTDMRLGEID